MPKAVLKDWLEPSVQLWPAEDGPWMVRLHWAVADGSIECVGMELRPVEPDGPARRIDAALLRRVPLGRLIRNARQARYEENQGPLIEVFDAARSGETPDPELVEWGIGLIDDSMRAAAGPWASRQALGRPRQYDDDHYKAVAGVYSRAVERGASPRQAVVQRWHTSGATASRWIARARELGHLPRTEPGRVRGSLDAAMIHSEGDR